MIERIPITVVRTPIRAIEEFWGVNPATISVEVDDALSKKLFNLPNELNIPFEEYRKSLQSRDLGFDVLEGTAKKYGKIYSKAWLELVEGYEDDKPLEQFDKAIFIACVSQQQAGCAITTADILYRHLIGAVNKNIVPEEYRDFLDFTSGKPKANSTMRDAILSSVDKLQGTRIKVNMTEVCRQFTNYNLSAYKRGGKIVVYDSILPGFICENALVNGKLTEDVIKFDRPSPLFIIAQTKKQILQYPRYILNAPRVPKTQTNIQLISYVTRRVQEIIKHKMEPTLTFDDIFGKCGLDGASKRQKLKAREVVKQFMRYLQNIEVIRNFDLPPEGNRLPKVKITY